MTATRPGTWRRLRRSVVVSGLIGLMVCWPLAASAADQVAFTITDSRIGQPSGLATDTGSNLYWAVDNSAGSGVVYGLTRKGHVRGSLKFRAQPRDVEAVAWSANRLYVADVGDKDASRGFVTVYFFETPSPDNTKHFYGAYDFTYPDGKHDAGTLLVNGAGRLFLVTKGPRAGIYAAPVKPSRQRINALSRVADAPTTVTDGVFLPQGGRVALRIEGAVEIMDGATFAKVASVPMSGQPKGESLTVSLDGASLLVGGAGTKSPVLAVDIPTAPAASASPSPNPSGSGGTSADDPAADENDPAPATSRTGTFLAVGLAALVALAAGIVVAAVHKPDSTGQQLADHPVDAPAEGDDVIGLDAGKHPDP